MGFFITLGLFAATWAISYLMREDEEVAAPKKVEFEEPRIQEGVPVQVFYGRVKITSPNVIWYGRPETRTVSVGGDIVAYAYKLSVQFALGLPVGTPDGTPPRASRLHKIWANDRLIPLIGFPTVSNPAQSIEIDSVNYFGPIGRGGGLKGTIKYALGDFTQTADAGIVADFDSIAELDSTLLPAYRGLAYVTFRNFEWGESGRMPKIAFEASSIPNALGLGRVGQDANPAEVLYDILTNPWGRLGMPTAQVDATSFTAAGTTLDAESHGYSIVINDSREAGRLIRDIVKQIDAVIYHDPATQKIAIKLIREDYLPVSGLPLFDESNVVGEPVYAAGSWEETYNAVRVQFLNRNLDYSQRMAFAQDQANVNVQARNRSTTIRYDGVTTEVLANTLANRDQRTLSIPQVKCTLLVNRDGATLLPGDVIRWRWSEYNITDMVLRVAEVDRGSLDDGRVKLTCVQDRFQFKFSSLADPPAVVTWPPVTSVQADDQKIIELPRFLALKGNVPNIDETRLLYLAGKPTGPDLAFAGTVSPTGDIGSFNTDKSDIPFVDTSLVKTLYARTAGPYDTTVGLKIKNPSGTTPSLAAATADEIRSFGTNLILIDDEIIAYESFTDDGGGDFTLNNIWRGLLDTTAVDHAVDAKVFFFPGLFEPGIVGDLVFVYLATLARKAQVVPRNAFTELPSIDADVLNAPTGTTCDPAPVNYCPSSRVNNTEWNVVNSVLINEYNITGPHGAKTATILDGTAGNTARATISFGGLLPSTTYTAWMRARTGTNHTADFEVYNEGNTSQLATVALSIVDAWTRFSLTFTTGASDTGVTIRIFPGEDGVATGVIGVDDVNVNLGSAPLEHVEMIEGERADARECPLLVHRALLPYPPQGFTIDGTNNPLTIEINESTGAWKRRIRTAVEIDRGDEADDAETGTTYDIEGRTTEVTAPQGWKTLSAAVDAASDLFSYEGLAHGSAEIRARSSRASGGALGELNSFQSPTIPLELQRFRQLLRNPGFEQGLTDWTTTSGTPEAKTGEGFDGSGAALGATAASTSYTIEQKVDVTPFKPAGKTAILKLYHKMSPADADDTLTVTLHALDSADTSLANVAFGPAISPAVVKGEFIALDLPADTAKLQVIIVGTEIGAGTECDVLVDDLDLRLGDIANSGGRQLLLNPTFNTNLASWTTVTGTPTRSTAATYEGAGSQLATTATAMEMYQEVTLPVGWKENGTAWLQGWRMNSATLADGAGEMLIEARTSGGAVLATATTGVETLAKDDVWRIRNIYLDLPATTDKVRVTLKSTQNATHTFFDELHLGVFKELYPAYREDAHFFKPAIQTFPDTALLWRDINAATSPTSIHELSETIGTEFADNMSQVSLTRVSTPEMGQTLAGFYDGTNQLGRKGFEVGDGLSTGAAYPTTDFCSMNGTDSFAILTTFRAPIGATAGSLMGSKGATGWDLSIDPTTGFVTLTVTGSASASVTTSTDFCGALHYVVVWYNATTGRFRLWSDLATQFDQAMPAGVASNINAVTIGHSAATVGVAAQFTYHVRWTGAAAEALTPAITNTWWKHGSDPSGKVSSYDGRKPLAGDIDSDANGIVAGAYSPLQHALIRGTGLSDGMGISCHRNLTNLIAGPTDGLATVGAPTITDRNGDDARRLRMATKIASTNVAGLKSSAFALALGDVTAVWYARSTTGSAHNARLSLTDSAGVVKETYDYSAGTTWARYERTFTLWDAATATALLLWSGSDTGSAQDIELSEPIGAWAISYAPVVSSVRAQAMGAGAILNMSMAPPVGFNAEGEVLVVGVADQSNPGNVNIVKITNGTNSNDRRQINFDNGTGGMAIFHYDGTGALATGTVDAARDWTEEWRARARWNTGRLLEEPAANKQAAVHADSDTYVRTATFSVSSALLDVIQIGEGGSFPFGGLVSRVMLSARELDL